MNLSKISVRYAKAIFLLAKEKGVLDIIYSDFKLIRDSIKKTPDFNLIISSPVILPADKIRVLTNTFANSVNEITMKFLVLVVEKNRETYIMDIIRNFETQYRNENNIKQVIVTTQHNLNTNTSENISDIVAKAYNSKVEIENIAADEMIGGIIIRIENKQLDLSIKTQLREIKKGLQSKAFRKII